MTKEAKRAVVCDANVLINLLHIDRMELCARLPDYRFVLPADEQLRFKMPFSSFGKEP